MKDEKFYAIASDDEDNDLPSSPDVDNTGTTELGNKGPKSNTSLNTPKEER